MTKLVIHGSKGRMGQTLIACAGHKEGMEIVGEIDENDDLSTVIADCDVVIDFSSHSITTSVAALCVKHQKAIVIGTTGHTDEEKGRILKHDGEIPIVLASNYSTGINALFWLTRKAAEILGTSFDLEVVEMHHRHKVDAPSGTAVTLGEILLDTRNQQKDVLRHGREGIVGARTDEEIGMHSLRGGDTVGDHSVIYAGSGERLELTHRAASRETFAYGALRAAQWVVGREPGLYTMQHVLGLE